MIGQQKDITRRPVNTETSGWQIQKDIESAALDENEKFGIPVLTIPGAYPGLEAEERGQGEAIARNIFEMVRLKVPIITIIVGEGASGGALGIEGDRVYMLENTWYSVISPESCSSILWKSWEYKEIAAEALKLTSSDMKRQN
jgi:acetyl-CoA carboxylase carboxyl transferase subunit alpha